MKILVLDQFSGLGGAQLCLREVLAEVQRRGWEAEVMAPGAGPLLEFARGCEFRASSLPLREYSTSRDAATDFLRFGMGLARSASMIRRAMRDRPADLIYVNGPRVLPLAIGLHTPVLFHGHSVPAAGYARRMTRWALRQTNASFIACSAFAAEAIREGSRIPSSVIYNGVADCGYRPRGSGDGPVPVGPVRVGLIGRIAPEKGHLDFLSAADRLKGREIQFVIAGSALFSDREFERQVRSHSAEAGVEVREWTNDVSGLLHGLDILAIPSAALEASTRVALEAMSAGVCVLAYPHGGLVELIQDARTGYFTASANAEALAEAIERLAGNPELRRRLAAEARLAWQEHFTVERFQGEVCDRMETAAIQTEPGASEAHSTPRETERRRDARPA